MSIEALVYPATPARHVTETVAGITFDDPYAWLEEDGSEALDRQRRQDELTQERVRRWDGFERLRDAVAPHIAECFLFAPLRRCERWFSLGFGQAGPELRVADGPTTAGRVLIDTAALSKDGPPASLDWFYPSPDGRYVAYGLSFGGDEQSILHVIETETGEVLPERIRFHVDRNSSPGSPTRVGSSTTAATRPIGRTPTSNCSITG